MADIKRPRYFRYQFLLENDFNEEQTYHVQMRHLQNHYLRSPGVVNGLQVEKVGPKEVRVLPGMAVDDNGQEIVVPPESPPLSVPLSSFDPDDEVYIAIQYIEENDPASEAEIGGNTVYTRVFEKAAAVADTTNPDTDPTRVTLGKVRLDGSGNIIDPIDFSDRQESTADIATGAVDTDQLADDAVTSTKLAEADGSSAQDTNAGSGVKTAHIQDDAVTVAKLAANAVTSAKLDEADGSSGQNTNAGSGVKSAHIQNSAVTEAKLATNAVTSTKLSNSAVIGSKIANNTIGEVKLDPATRGKLVTNGNSHDHDGSDGIKITPTNLAGVNSSVTASNLNTLTGGTTNASALHYHQSFPTQTKIYTPAFPLLESGSSPKFTPAPYSARCPAGQRCYGITPVYLPPGYDMIKMGIQTQSSSAFNMTFWLVYSTSGSSGGVLVRGITVTSGGLNESTFRHTIQPSRNYLFWVYMNSAPASTVTISGIFLEYEYSTL